MVVQRRNDLAVVRVARVGAYSPLGDGVRRLRDQQGSAPSRPGGGGSGWGEGGARTMCSLLQEEAVGHGEFQAISKPTLVPRQHSATTTVRTITSPHPPPHPAPCLQ